MQNIVTHSHKAAKDRMQRNYARPHCVDPADARNPVDAWHAAWIETGMVDQKTLQQIILPPRTQTPLMAPNPNPKQPHHRQSYRHEQEWLTLTDQDQRHGQMILPDGESRSSPEATAVTMSMPRKYTVRAAKSSPTSNNRTTEEQLGGPTTQRNYVRSRKH